MSNAKQEIISALIDDIEDSNGYCCFEILEPYVNANRLKELSEHQIAQHLVELVASNQIEAFETQEKNGKESWAPTNVTVWNARNKWYHIVQ